MKATHLGTISGRQMMEHLMQALGNSEQHVCDESCNVVKIGTISDDEKSAMAFIDQKQRNRDELKAELEHAQKEFQLADADFDISVDRLKRSIKKRMELPQSSEVMISTEGMIATTRAMAVKAGIKFEEIESDEESGEGSPD
jgi:hypothetical protein